MCPAVSRRSVNPRLLGSARPDWPLTERDGFHVNVTGGWLSAVAGFAHPPHLDRGAGAAAPAPDPRLFAHRPGTAH